MTNARPFVQVEVDPAADAAYVRVQESAAVATTESLTDEVLIDLDAVGVVVGIEVLRLDAVIPFSEIVRRYHLHSSVEGIVGAIRPNVGGFVAKFVSGPDGASAGLPVGELSSSTAS